MVVTLSLTVFVVAAATLVSGGPPRPGTTNSSLTESEEATLWANQPPDAHISNDAYRDAYEEPRSAVHELANGTDISFRRPPATARRWTHYAHQTFRPGDTATAKHPPTTATTDGRFIKDAHATIFSVTPATHAHIAPNDTRHYIAPTGAVRAVVDYRLSPAASDGNAIESQTIQDHAITEVRLYAGPPPDTPGENDTRGVLARQSGSHHPVLEYRLDDTTIERVGVAVDIEVTVSYPGVNGSRIVETEHVTVTDSIMVTPYDLRAMAQYARYPDGTMGAAVYQTAPWHGYTLSTDDGVSVRGVWRYFTARNKSWDTLTVSTATDDSSVESDVLPVAVHAYPSRLGPRTEPEAGGPDILRTWGDPAESPVSTPPANVSVEVVEEAYSPTYGVAVRSSQVDPAAVTVHGIVAGTDATINNSTTGPRDVRESRLTATQITENATGITIRFRLETAATGTPIELDNGSRRAPFTERGRPGVITVAGRRVKTNATGHAVVHLTEPGVYTARYEAASWLDSHPTYTNDSVIVRWHPLLTADGWLASMTRWLPLSLVLIGLWLLGRRLGHMLAWRYTK